MSGHKENYKGRAIEVVEKGQKRELRIDGKPVHYEVAEDGSIESHDFMFRVFASPEELARAVIDQGPTT